jgi:hypothetical protein
MTTDKNHTDVLLEDIHAKFDAILEIVAPMRKKLTEIRTIVDDIPEMKDDIAVIKKVIKETNIKVRDHEQRITKLEKARA